MMAKASAMQQQALDWRRRMSARFSRWLGLSFNTLLKDMLEQLRAGQTTMGGQTWAPNAFIIYLDPGAALEMGRIETPASGGQRKHGLEHDFPRHLERIIYQEVIREEGFRLIPLSSRQPIYCKIWIKSGLPAVTVEYLHLDPAIYQRWPENDPRDLGAFIDEARAAIAADSPAQARRALAAVLPAAPLHADLHVLEALAALQAGDLEGALAALLYLHHRRLWQHAAQAFCVLAQHDLAPAVHWLLGELAQQHGLKKSFARSLEYYRAVLDVHARVMDQHNNGQWDLLVQDWLTLQEFTGLLPQPWLIPAIALPLLAALLLNAQEMRLSAACQALDWSTWIKSVCARKMIEEMYISYQPVMEALTAWPDPSAGFPAFWRARLLQMNAQDLRETPEIRRLLKLAYRKAPGNRYYHYIYLQSQRAGADSRFAEDD